VESGEARNETGCRVTDASLISKYRLFIWEVVKAHVATSPKYFVPVHYRGEGVSMISGRQLARAKIRASRSGRTGFGT
jgi:hypothetical protein